MHCAYKRILKRRNSLLMQELVYDKNLAKIALEEELLPKQILQEIEADSNKENRLFVLLAKLPKQSSGTFHKFMTVLKRAGYQELQTILQCDRDNIRSELDIREDAESLSDYFEKLRNHLLPAIRHEDDEFIRNVYVSDVEKRLETLKKYVERKENTRKKIRNLLQNSLDDVGDGSTSADEVQSYRGSRDDFLKGLTRFEESEDEVFLLWLKGKMELLQGDNERLKEELESSSRFSTMFSEGSSSRISSVISVDDASATFANADDIDSASTQFSTEQRLSLLTSLLFKREEEIFRLQAVLREQEVVTSRRCETMAGKRVISLSANDYEYLINTLKVYVQRNCFTENHGVDLIEESLQTPVNETNGVNGLLKEGVTSLVNQIQMLRSRVKQMSGRISDLEKERCVIVTSLFPLKTDLPFSEAVLATFDKLRQDSAALEKELRGLRARIAEMTENERILMNRFQAFSSNAENEASLEIPDKTHQKRSSTGKLSHRHSATNHSDDYKPLVVKQAPATNHCDQCKLKGGVSRQQPAVNRLLKNVSIGDEPRIRSSSMGTVKNENINVARVAALKTRRFSVVAMQTQSQQD